MTERILLTMAIVSIAFGATGRPGAPAGLLVNGVSSRLSVMRRGSHGCPRIAAVGQRKPHIRYSYRPMPKISLTANRNGGTGFSGIMRMKRKASI